MVSRMDKYHSESTTHTQSRSKKNQNLYNEQYTNKVFVDFTNIQNNNAIDLDNVSRTYTHGKREEFQKNRLLNSENLDSTSKKDYSSSNVDSVPFYTEEKNYNINDVLENAKKNRTSSDEIEKKRHLKSVEYNILSDLNQEKLKQYHEQKKKMSKAEEENLEELIHTITSNSLRKKIDDELLNDLLPTSETETLISDKMLKDLEDQSVIDSTTEEMDKSFYTKSMDLSEKDFDLNDMNEEDRSFVEEKEMSIGKKIFLIVLVTIVLIIIGYIIFRFI